MTRTTEEITPNQTADKSYAGFLGALATGLSAALANGGDISTEGGILTVVLAGVTAAVVWLKRNYLSA